MSITPITLLVHNNRADARVGRNRTPIRLADAGIEASFDRALAAYDGSVSGPLISGDYMLDLATDTLTHVMPDWQVVRNVRDTSDAPHDLIRNGRRMISLETGEANEVELLLGLARIALGLEAS